MGQRLEAGEEVDVGVVVTAAAVVVVVVGRAKGNSGSEVGAGPRGRRRGSAALAHLFLALYFEGRGVHGGKRWDVGPLAVHLEHAEHARAHLFLFLLHVDGVVVVVLLLQFGRHLLELTIHALLARVDPLEVSVMLFGSSSWALPARVNADPICVCARACVRE
jgi:hypothetical protein